MKFPYGQILRESWFLMTKNRILWLLAIFVSEASIFLNFTLEDSRNFSKVISSETWQQNIGNLAIFNFKILSFVIIITAIAIVFALVSLICKAGLIDGISSAVKKNDTDLSAHIKFGWHRLLVMLFLEILVFLPNLIFVSLIVFSFIKLNSAVTYGLLVVFLLYNIFVAFFRHYSYCYICLEGMSAWPALKAGVNLLVKNFVPTLAINLIKLGINIGVAIGGLLAVLILAVPFFLLMLLSASFGSWQVSFAIIGLGAVIGVIALFIIKGMKVTYLYLTLTKTFWELKKNK